MPIPAWGIWAHRQALAVRDRGVDVRVLALERPLPPLRDAARAARSGPLREWARRSRSAAAARPTLDGIPVRYVRFVSPPRPLSYASWGRWAAPAAAAARSTAGAQAARPDPRPLRGARGRRRRCAGSAAAATSPLVVSVHGGDLSYAAARSRARAARRSRACLRAADAVIANSEVTRRGDRGADRPAARGCA